jgi:hypothetical protein
MKYGYARVSPGGKSESVDAQARQLTKAGCRKVFRDVHVSGAKADRAQLRRLLDQLEADDVLMVTRLDRLARSTRDLLNILATITGRKARRLKRLTRCCAPTSGRRGRSPQRCGRGSWGLTSQDKPAGQEIPASRPQSILNAPL